MVRVQVLACSCVCAEGASEATTKKGSVGGQQDKESEERINVEYASGGTAYSRFSRLTTVCACSYSTSKIQITCLLLHTRVTTFQELAYVSM